MDRTEPQEIPRRLCLVDAGEGMQVECFALRRRWAFGRWDIYCAPARGQGGRWVREDNLEYLEPEQEEADDE